MPIDDPDAFRAASRERWEQAARGWTSSRDAFQTAAAPVTQWLVDALDPEPGWVLLELAAGLGDTGFEAVRRAQPGGRLLSTDGAEAMVAAAAERARSLGLTDAEVQTRVMEAEWLDLSAATVDGVVCRWGYMLLADPEAALRETRRVLKPGGRLALAIWDSARANPWSMGRLLVELGFAEEAAPGLPGPFALGDAERVRELLLDVGFDDVRVEAVDFAFTAADADSWWAQQLDCSPTLGQVTSSLSPADHTRLRDAVDEALAAYAQPDGTLRIPARTLVAVASA